MEVILREHVENLGSRGEVVKVAAGYARNFLLPRKLALAVTAGNVKQIEREKRLIVQREAKDRDAAMAQARLIEATPCRIERRAGETDVLYGSVTTSDIAECLARTGIEVDRRKIQIAEPIKRLGEFIVPVKLYRDVTAQITVTVVKEEEEGGEKP